MNEKQQQQQRIQRTQRRLERLRAEPKPIKRRCACGDEHYVSIRQAALIPAGSWLDMCLPCFHMLVTVEGAMIVRKAREAEDRGT